VLPLPTIEKLPDTMQAKQLLTEVGSNRAPVGNKQIAAEDDLSAMNTWLDEYSHTPSTFRVYQKEAERLLLWCIFNHKKPLSSLNRDDFEAYIQFMQDPQPRALWCGRQGGRGNKRGSSNWKPFSSPLNQASLTTAISIINSLMTYLVDAGYLQANPLRLLRKAKRRPQLEERKIEVQARILEPEEWEAMLESMNSMPEATPHEKDEKYRLRFIVAMLYFLGLRVGELTSHTWNAFQRINGRWWFIVRGKGDKLGKVPVNAALLEVVQEFRRQMRMPDLPAHGEDAPLVPSWRHAGGLQPRAINVLLKRLAVETAERHFQDKPTTQAKLIKFSAHWLRHLSATMQDRAGIPFAHVRSNLRHQSDETTRTYVHGDEFDRCDMNTYSEGDLD